MELTLQPVLEAVPHQVTDLESLRHEYVSLIEQKNALEMRVRKIEEQVGGSAQGYDPYSSRLRA